MGQTIATIKDHNQNLLCPFFGNLVKIFSKISMNSVVCDNKSMFIYFNDVY